ncbi:MAG: haloalkane dehalogenase [Porticoccaceae bacterium]|nr:haloalkane dehalogenase [Porticoccaceae bacterium]
MKILRTPDSRFASLEEYPFEPHYTVIKTDDGSDLRIHHIDEGPKDGAIILCMHGQPVWSYLYARMIPHLAKAGLRVIAPDLPGYGKSDKPAAREDYSYQRQVDWMNQWLVQNNFTDLTFFGQDWGGLIGLRMVADNGERFARVAIGNTGLPYNPNVAQSTIDRVNAFRADPKKLSLFGMMKQVGKMSGIGKDSGVDLFAYWQKYTWETPDVPAGIIASSQMESRNKLAVALELFVGAIGLRHISPFRTRLSRAYEAPFPSPAYKMGPRAMPSQVPTIPDQSLEAQKKAWEFFEKFKKPFLCVGAGNDPITNGFEKIWLSKVPGTKGQPHTMIGGGHFFQWAKAEKLSALLAEFIEQNPTPKARKTAAKKSSVRKTTAKKAS